MSKMFLGATFFLAGMAFWAIDMATMSCVRPNFTVSLCAGALIGAGGVLAVWAMTDHLATRKQATPNV